MESADVTSFLNPSLDQKTAEQTPELTIEMTPMTNRNDESDGNNSSKGTKGTTDINNTNETIDINNINDTNETTDINDTNNTNDNDDNNGTSNDTNNPSDTNDTNDDNGIDDDNAVLNVEAGVSMHVDEETGHSYSYNEATGHTQWLSDDDDVSEATHEGVGESKQETLRLFRKFVNDDSDVYYENAETGEVVWNLPEDGELVKL